MSGDALRSIWLASAAAVGVATVAALAVLLTGEPGVSDGRMMATFVGVLLCGAGAVAGLELLDRPGLRPLGVLVVLAALVDFVVYTLGVWEAEPFDGEDSGFLKMVPIGLAWGIAILVAAACFLTSNQRVRFLAAAAAAVAAAFAIVATGLIWAENDSDGWLKLLGTLAILMVGGFLLVPLARRLVRPV